MPKPRPLQRQPANTLVSESLTVPSTLRFAPVRRAINLVDRTHGDGELQPLHVRGRRMEPGILGGYALANDQPRGIVFAAGVPISPTTVLEEIGHMLDHQTLGGSSPQWASQDPNSDIAEVMEAIRQSPTVRRVAGYQYKQMVSLRRGSELESVRVTDRERLEYEQDESEWFARAYTQFIAISTGDREICAELARLISTKKYEILYPRAWPDDEFEAIVDALERVFRAKGWMR